MGEAEPEEHDPPGLENEMDPLPDPGDLVDYEDIPGGSQLAADLVPFNHAMTLHLFPASSTQSTAKDAKLTCHYFDGAYYGVQLIYKDRQASYYTSFRPHEVYGQIGVGPDGTASRMRIYIKPQPGGNITTVLDTVKSGFDPKNVAPWKPEAAPSMKMLDFTTLPSLSWKFDPKAGLPTSAAGSIEIFTNGGHDILATHLMGLGAYAIHMAETEVGIDGTKSIKVTFTCPGHLAEDIRHTLDEVFSLAHWNEVHHGALRVVTAKLVPREIKKHPAGLESPESGKFMELPTNSHFHVNQIVYVDSQGNAVTEDFAPPGHPVGVAMQDNKDTPGTVVARLSSMLGPPVEVGVDFPKAMEVYAQPNGDVYFRSHDRTVFVITNGGRIIVVGITEFTNPGVQAWAETFWRMVEQYNPLKAEVSQLGAALATMRERAELIHKGYLELRRREEKRRELLQSPPPRERDEMARLRFGNVAENLRPTKDDPK